MTHPIDNQYRYGVVYNLNGQIVGFNLSPDVYISLTDGEIEKVLEAYAKRKHGQDPCNDVISRQAVKDTIFAECSCIKLDIDFAKVLLLQRAIEAIDSVPSPWIPVSEGLPEEETDVLICNADGNIEITSGSYSTEMKNEFIWYTTTWGFGKVVAWMPLPEPYKEESEGEK